MLWTTWSKCLMITGFRLSQIRNIIETTELHPWQCWWGWWWWWWWSCCEESWRRCKLGGHRSFLLQFQAMVSQEEDDDDDIQGLPVWEWKNWKAKESKIQAKQELWKQVELMRFRKMACNSATALAQSALVNEWPRFAQITRPICLRPDCLFTV